MTNKHRKNVCFDEYGMMHAYDDVEPCGCVDCE